jgi:hypothetical protein
MPALLPSAPPAYSNQLWSLAHRRPRSGSSSSCEYVYSQRCSVGSVRPRRHVHAARRRDASSCCAAAGSFYQRRAARDCSACCRRSLLWRSAAADRACWAATTLAALRSRGAHSASTAHGAAKLLCHCQPLVPSTTGAAVIGVAAGLDLVPLNQRRSCVLRCDTLRCTALAMHLPRVCGGQETPSCCAAARPLLPSMSGTGVIGMIAGPASVPPSRLRSFERSRYALPKSCPPRRAALARNRMAPRFVHAPMRVCGCLCVPALACDLTVTVRVGGVRGTS